MARKSKKFRVATEGATTDGRQIERGWIEQMARNYDPKKYGARVNMEHIKGLFPDSPFKRYGDVLALSAEPVEDGKLALFAVIDPTDELVRMTTQERQKVYTSIEIDHDFAQSGEAYLVGLAVTDDPASLGTEMLQFSATAKHSPLARRKLDPDNLFTEAIEFTLELEDEADAPSLFSKVKELLAGKQKTDHAQFADMAQAVEAVASQVQALSQQLAAAPSADALTQLSDQLSTLQADHQSLLTQLSLQPTTAARAPATGGTQRLAADC